MKLYLLVFFLFLLQSVTGQVLFTDPSQPFSKESRQLADQSLATVNKPYKIIYMPVKHFVMPPKDLGNEKPTLAKVLNGELAARPDYLLKALTVEQAADLIKAKDYFDKQKDKEHTILVLHNIEQTFETGDKNARVKYLEGRQFVFGDAVPASIRQVVTSYSPAAKLDFNAQALVANDNYLKEYTSGLVTTVNKKGAGSIVEDKYPKMIPLLIMIVDGIGYVHADPAAGLADLTNDEQETLKTEIKALNGKENEGRYNVYPIEKVEFTPIDYKLKDKDFFVYGLEMVYAYKNAKTDSFKLRQNKNAERTFKLNDNVMETINPADGKFAFTVFAPDKGVASKYILKDGENIFTISTDLGPDYAQNNLTTTFVIKFSYNSNKFFIKARINDKDLAERVDWDKKVGDKGGRPMLKIGEQVDLSLYKQEGATEKLVNTAMWTKDNETFVTADHYKVTITADNNNIAVKSGEDGYLNMIQFSYQKTAVNEDKYSFVKVNVDALSSRDKKIARELYKKALTTIAGKNKTLSDFFVSNDAMIQTYVVPRTDPALKNAKIGDGVRTLMGFANKGMYTTMSYKYLDVINIKKTGKGIIEDATLVARLSVAEKRALLAASDAKNVASVGAILQKLADKNISAKFSKLIGDGVLTEAVLNENEKDCYALIPDNVNVLREYLGGVGMNTKKVIYLNYDDITTNKPGPKGFASITAHEMMHIYYTAKNYYATLKWSVIRDKQAQYGYGLGESPCSMADGHEEYNPEDKATCDEQTKY